MFEGYREILRTSSTAEYGRFSKVSVLYMGPLFQIFTQSIDAIDFTSVTLSGLNNINAIDILGIFSGYLWDISEIFLGYL